MFKKPVLSVRNRLVLGFSFLIGLLLIVGVYSLNQVELLGQQTVKMYKHPLTVTRASLLASAEIIKMHRGMKDVALAKDEGGIEKAKAQVAEHEKEVYKQYAVVEDRILGKEGEQLIAETIQIFRDWKPIRDEVIALMSRGDRIAAADITKGKGAKHVRLLMGNMDALVSYASEKAGGFYQKAQSTTQETWVLTIVLAAVAVVMGVIAAIVILRSVLNPLEALRTTIRRIESDSDLTRQIELSSKDEIGLTASAFNTMLGKFRTSLARVSESTSKLAVTAEETSAVTEQTTQAVQTQLDETAQLATAMTEMVSTVKEVATNVAHSANAANAANDQTTEGLAAMQETISQIQQLASEVQNASTVIQQLEQQSEEIGSVVDVIKGIADQTNLLALNAAIEAARAGEQGRGFAVVSDEVRNLASKTQISTEEINTIIEKLQAGSRRAGAAMSASRETAVAATEQAAQTGNVLSSIAEAIGGINEMSAQIASAAEEQSAVAEEINKNVVQINGMGEQVSAGAQQTTKASGDLSHLASTLQNLVADFKIA